MQTIHKFFISQLGTHSKYLCRYSPQIVGQRNRQMCRTHERNLLEKIKDIISRDLVKCLHGWSRIKNLNAVFNQTLDQNQNWKLQKPTNHASLYALSSSKSGRCGGHILHQNGHVIG